MRFKEGTTVETIEGEAVGRIDQIVIDPTDDRVTHVVVKQGFLFTEDRVVPVDYLQQADNDRVILSATEEDFESFPPFEQTHYFRPERDYHPSPLAEDRWETTRPLFFYVAPHSGMYPPPAGLAGAGRVKQTVRNVPAHTVAVEKGTKVLTTDDKHAGDVQQTFTDEDGNITHLLVSKGFIFTTEKLIPIHWVDRMTDSEIYLSVRTALVEDLPAYEEN